MEAALFGVTTLSTDCACVRKNGLSVSIQPSGLNMTARERSCFLDIKVNEAKLRSLKSGSIYWPQFARFLSLLFIWRMWILVSFRSVPPYNAIYSHLYIYITWICRPHLRSWPSYDVCFIVFCFIIAYILLPATLAAWWTRSESYNSHAAISQPTLFFPFSQFVISCAVVSPFNFVRDSFFPSLLFFFAFALFWVNIGSQRADLSLSPFEFSISAKKTAQSEYGTGG